MPPLATIAALLGTLALAAGPSFAAGLRTLDNVPLASLPADVQAGQPRAQLERGYLDVTLPPYEAIPDDGRDDRVALQRALDDGYNFNLVTWLKRGTFDVSGPLTALQKPRPGLSPGQRTFAYKLMGDRAVLRFRDGALAAGQVGLRFEYTRADGSPDPIGPTRHYNAEIRNVVLDVGNNPGAVALSMDGAQLCSIENVTIRGTSFLAGVRELPGSGGSTTGLTVLGGDWGVIQNGYRPSPSVHGLVLRGQRLGGIQHNGSRGPLVIVGADIEAPRPIVSANPLVVRDAKLRAAAPNGIAIEHGGDALHLSNVFANAATIVRSTPNKTVPGQPGVWLRLAEHAYAAGGVPLVIDGQPVGTDGTARVWQRRPPQEAAPSPDLVSRHVDDLPLAPLVETIDVRSKGATPGDARDDDAPAILAALAESAASGKPAFVPRGRFHVRRPIEVPLGAELIGAADNISVILADASWKPTAPTALLRTADGMGSVLIANLAIEALEPATRRGWDSHKHLVFFHGRSSDLLVRIQISRREAFSGSGNTFDQPVALFTGAAGGRIYNLALDLHTVDGTATPQHRMIAIRGTTNPLALYQPNVEGTLQTQIEIRDADRVSMYGLKIEDRRRLMDIIGSRRIAILGGSGNYTLYGGEGDCIVCVQDSPSYVVTALVRKGPMRTPPFFWLIDGDLRTTGVPASSGVVVAGLPFAVEEEPPPPPDPELVALGGQLVGLIERGALDETGWTDLGRRALDAFRGKGSGGREAAWPVVPRPR